MTDKIHPDVIAHWEKQGWKIDPRYQEFYASPDLYSSMLWDACKDNRMLHTVAMTFSDGSPTVYYWGGKEWNDKEILRVMKLNAFL